MKTKAPAAKPGEKIDSPGELNDLRRRLAAAESRLAAAERENLALKRENFGLKLEKRDTLIGQERANVADRDRAANAHSSRLALISERKDEAKKLKEKKSADNSGRGKASGVTRRAKRDKRQEPAVAIALQIDKESPDLSIPDFADEIGVRLKLAKIKISQFSQSTRENFVRRLREDKIIKKTKRMRLFP